MKVLISDNLAPVGEQILKDAGITKKELVAAIKEFRKGAKAQSQSAEETYHGVF